MHVDNVRFHPRSVSFKNMYLSNKFVSYGVLPLPLNDNNNNNNNNNTWNITHNTESTAV